jgi:hypothetical protein
MEKIELIVRIGLLVVTVLTAIFFTITTIIKKKKKGEEITPEVVTEVFTENLTIISNIKDKLLDYMAVAEEKFKTMVNSSNKKDISTMKLNDVLLQIKLDCLTANIPYDESYWKDQIAKYCDLTKKIN